MGKTQATRQDTTHPLFSHPRPIIILVNQSINRLTNDQFTGNRFDFFTTLVLFAASIGYLCLGLDAATLRFFTLGRVMRLVNLASRTETFSSTFSCIAKMSAGGLQVITTLFLVISLWALLGVQIYGGLVYAGNENLAETDYYNENYDALNCNDVPMCLFTLISVLASLPPKELIEGFGAVSSGGKWGAVAFFISFFYICALLFFNVFVSFMIEAFLTTSLEVKSSGTGEYKEMTDESLIEPGFKILHKEALGEIVLFKKMFANELAEIIK